MFTPGCDPFVDEAPKEHGTGMDSVFAEIKSLKGLIGTIEKRLDAIENRLDNLQAQADWIERGIEP